MIEFNPKKNHLKLGSNETMIVRAVIYWWMLPRCFNRFAYKFVTKKNHFVRCKRSKEVSFWRSSKEPKTESYEWIFSVCVSWTCELTGVYCVSFRIHLVEIWCCNCVNWYRNDCITNKVYGVPQMTNSITFIRKSIKKFAHTACARIAIDALMAWNVNAGCFGGLILLNSIVLFCHSTIFSLSLRSFGRVSFGKSWASRFRPFKWPVIFPNNLALYRALFLWLWLWLWLHASHQSQMGKSYRKGVLFICI